MKSFKKMSVLGLASICFLASCNHRTVDAKTITEFINNNYKDKTVKTVDKIELSFSMSCSDNDDAKAYSKDYVKKVALDCECTSEEYEEGSLSFKKSNWTKTKPSAYNLVLERAKKIIDDNVITVWESAREAGSTVVYTISKNEMSAWLKVNDTVAIPYIETEANGTQEQTLIFNDNGQLRFDSETFSWKVGDNSYKTKAIFNVTFKA